MSRLLIDFLVFGRIPGTSYEIGLFGYLLFILAIAIAIYGLRRGLSRILHKLYSQSLEDVSL